MNADPLRMRFTLFAMGLVLVSNTIGALTRAGPTFALVTTAITLAVMVGWTIHRRDPVLARWLVIGLVAGWLEIVTDEWLVRSTATLLYPQQPPMVGESPLYMPFAWTLVIAQLGVFGGWLAERMGVARATLVCALAGGLMIPLYEFLAHYANYWTYVATPMVWHAPYYIIVSEFLLVLPLVWMGRVAERHSLLFSGFLGIVEGLWMLPSVLLAWWLVGPCRGALIQFGCG
jgi:hypothetical protein